MMAYLLDLPETARREIAVAWGAPDAATAEIYRLMTDSTELDRAIAAVSDTARAALVRLAREPAAFEELLAALPISRARLESDLEALGRLGLAQRLPEPDRPPRRARPPFGSETLYTPRDAAVALGVPR